jgi:hypothetical protein
MGEVNLNGNAELSLLTVVMGAGIFLGRIALFLYRGMCGTGIVNTG